MNKAETDSIVNEAFENICLNIKDRKNDFNKLRESLEVSIAWHNVIFETRELAGLKWKRKRILSDLSGTFQSGTLNGVLGPSGAGKSTLLNILSGSQCLTGQLSHNSQIFIQPSWPTSYFISQHVHENIIGELTVGQILQYAFEFKNGSSTFKSLMQNHITQIMSTLMLPEKMLDQPFARCSGGEQKRVAIAQELMSLKAPNFLFTDEPSTGLDSVSAFQTMKCLQKLAKDQNITIIASIHSPNQETLHLFDQLYVLAKGGACIFSGPPSEIKPFLTKNLLQSAQFTNSKSPPIETLIKIACNGTTNSTVLQQLTIATNATVLQQIKPLQPYLSLQPHGLPNTRKSFHFRDLLLQTARFFRVTFITGYRSFLLSILLFTIYIVLLSTMFNTSMTQSSGCVAFSDTQNQTCVENIKEETLLKENATFLANILIYTGVVTICTSAVVFASIIKVFRSEHRNQWYSLGTFYWSVVFVSFLELLVHAFLTALLGYFLPSQHAVDNYTLNWNRFAHYVFFMWLLCFYMQSMGHLVGLIFVDHVQLAVVVCIIYHTGATMINGFFVDTEMTGNVFLIEISNLVAFKFIARGILYTFYGIDRCNFEKEFSVIFRVFHVDPNYIFVYVMRVFLNIIAIRLLTLVIIYFKFGNWKMYSCFKKELIKNSVSKTNIFENENITKLEKPKFLNGHTNVILKSNQTKVEIIENEILRNKNIIAWRNLSLFADDSIFEIGYSNVQRKQILCNLNGQFCFGTLNGLLGTSGAGKSSLLKVLSGQMKTKLSSETEIYLSTFSAIQTCFITQEVSGHLLNGLTAKQSMIFASRFKNTQVRSTEEHEAIVFKWLSELDLLEAAETKVENCSGGERKRLAVALELTALQMPNLICIDEPTSGLDSNSAETVIGVLRRLATKNPLTIIASIHQPTAEMLYMFDQLYVLARGGLCIYSGNSDGLQSHLESVSDKDGSCLSSSSHQLPIEVLIKYSCLSAESETVQKLVSTSNLQWSNSLLQLSTETQLTPDGVQPNRTRFSLSSVCITFHRYFLNFRQHLWKEHIFLSANYLFYGIVIPLFYESRMVEVSGCIDLASGDLNAMCSRDENGLDTLFQLLNNFKYTFFYANFFTLFVMLQQALSFFKELKVFENEHQNGWYSSGTFYLTKSAFELLILLPTILLYVYLGNLYENIRPGIYWNIVFLFILATVAFQSMGQMFTLLSRGNISLLIITSVSVFLFFVLLSNFLLLNYRLPVFYQWLSNFAISRFIFEALILLQYGFGRCAEKEIQVTLYTMKIADDDFYHCILMLVFNMIIYRLVAFYLLYCKVNLGENRSKRLERIDKCNSSVFQNLKVVNIF